MSISEQVKELRRIAEEWNPNCLINPVSVTLNKAADTIESLSAKLADLKRSAYDCDSEWILCKDRLPTKEECGNYRGHFLVTVYTNKLTTLYMEYEYVTIRGKEVGRWIWCDRVNLPWEVIAWRPLPDPYHET